MSITLKFYFEQFSPISTHRDEKATKLHNTHLMKVLDNLRQYFLREKILITDDIEYSCPTIKKAYITSYIFILNDNYNFKDMYENLRIPSLNVDEEYSFETQFDTIVDNKTITKYIKFETIKDNHSSGYYEYHKLKDNSHLEFINLDK